MRTRANLIAATILLTVASSASAAIHYVDVNSTSPTPPFTNWTTAATTIQDAVEAAVAGDQILVTNGVYQNGGRVVDGELTNRVAVTKPVTVQSVNGAAATVIRGFQAPGTTNGDGAVRCVYLGDGAALVGFTLTNGATRLEGEFEGELSGGGVWCESGNASISNCVLIANSARGSGGGAWRGTLDNCVVTANSAAGSGGGVNRCTLNNCSLIGNSAAADGGGAFGGSLYRCTLRGNSAGRDGGGAIGTVNGPAHTPVRLVNCTLSGNSAIGWGGGVTLGALTSCTVVGNSAIMGGGVFVSTLQNCIVYFNTALEGANHNSCTLEYCCTTPLPTEGIGNISSNPRLASASHLSAASPCRGAGSSDFVSGTDIDGEPWADPPSIGCDEYRPGPVTLPLSASIRTSFTNVAVGYPVDFMAWTAGPTAMTVWDFADGEVATNQPFTAHAWRAPGDYSVVLRAYNESLPGGIAATVTIHVVTPPVHYVAAGNSNPVAPYSSWATAATNIQCAIDSFDAATLPGSVVLVTNGVYATGGRAVYGTMTNRVVVDKPLTVRSVNGPQLTVIQGYQVLGTIIAEGAIRCAYLKSGASLSGFTLTNGATSSMPDQESSGGGVWCESASALVSNCVVAANSAWYGGGGARGGTLKNCTLIGNSAGGGGGAYGSILYNCTLTRNSASEGGGAESSILNNCTLSANSATDAGGGAAEGTLENCALTGNWAAGYGGGAYYSTLNNCTLTGNFAVDGILYPSFGGGAAACTLNNCTLTGNSASSGGGVVYGTLNNCIVYYNVAGQIGANYSGAYDYPVALNFCCTTPQPTNGIGNITNAPLFFDYAAGNLRLQSNSPCINSGLNLYAPAGPDLDGNPRIAGGTVDIGAYEFQSPASVISYAWLQQYGLPTDSSADFTDPDGDELNNWQEWRSGTDPTNALSVLQMLSPTRGASGLIVSWQSVSGLNYFLERGTDLGAQPPFLPLTTNIVGQPGTTTFIDTNAVGAGPFFYRVVVSPP